MDWNEFVAIVQLIVIATFAAGSRAFLGYWKNREKEDLDAVKLLKTVLLGTLLGFFAGLLTAAGYTSTPETVQSLLVSFGLFAGLTTVVEDAAKGLWRWVKAKFGVT